LAQERASRYQRRKNKMTKGDVKSDKEVTKIMLGVLAVMLVTFIVVVVIKGYKPPVKLETPAEYVKDSTQKVVVEFTVQDRGTFQMELYNDKMPETVENFVSNIYNKSYVGKKFHRVDTYMLVAGGSDDEYDTMSSTELKFEQHEELVNVGRYAVGMVKHSETGDNSRVIFMISKANQENLSGEYSMFGKIIGISSENVVDAIALDDVISDVKIVSIDDVEYTGGYANSDVDSNADINAGANVEATATNNLNE